GCWVDYYGTVWNADQQGGKWGAPQAVGGSLQGGVENIGTPQSALRDPVGIAALQLNATTELAFWLGSDQSVWMNARIASGWGAPSEIAPAGSAVGAIDAVAESSTHVDVVWIGPMGNIVDASWTGNAGYTFTINSSVGMSGASISSGITAVVGGANAGDLNVFWISSSGQVVQEVRDATSGSWLVTPVIVTATAGTAGLDSGVAAATTSAGEPPASVAAGRIYLTWVDPGGILWTAYNDYFQDVVCRQPLPPCPPPGTWGVGSHADFARAAPNPLAIASRTPTNIDVLFTTRKGAVWDASSSLSTGWTAALVASAENGCDPCGQGPNGWACNGICGSGTATETVQCAEGNGTGGCNPGGGDGVCYACGNNCPTTSCSASAGTVLQSSCFYSTLA